MGPFFPGSVPRSPAFAPERKGEGRAGRRGELSLCSKLWPSGGVQHFIDLKDLSRFLYLTEKRASFRGQRLSGDTEGDAKELNRKRLL